MNITAHIHPLTYLLDTKQDLKICLTDFDGFDFDDVIDAVEEKINEDYGVAAHFNVDFTITNERDICEKLLDLQAELDETEADF